MQPLENLILPFPMCWAALVCLNVSLCPSNKRKKNVGFSGKSVFREQDSLSTVLSWKLVRLLLLKHHMVKKEGKC